MLGEADDCPEDAARLIGSIEPGWLPAQGAAAFRGGNSVTTRPTERSRDREVPMSWFARLKRILLGRSLPISAREATSNPKDGGSNPPRRIGEAPA